MPPTPIRRRTPSIAAETPAASRHIGRMRKPSTLLLAIGGVAIAVAVVVAVAGYGGAGQAGIPSTADFSRE
jgi:hypothetical protein